MIEAKKNRSQSTDLQLSLFKSKIGWLGLLGDTQSVIGLKIGYSSSDKVRQVFLKEFEQDCLEMSDWNPELRQRLQNYTAGEHDDFLDISIQIHHETIFQKKVRKQTRLIPYGHQSSYMEVAKQAGSPKAARAVGTVMRKNPIPIIMPCHRVISSDGSLGGFSAPTGTQLKKKLIELECKHPQ